MQKNYDHIGSEDNIYKSWEDSGKMRANANSDKKPFVITLPPPNVTGKLHLGHAAMLAIEDIMIRFKRMTGYEAVWIPGTDHAAIATENVVIKHLGMKGREELTRDQFLAECRKFASDSHDTIVNQTKKMGAWLDWSREAYTFDEARNNAVNSIFKQLYEDGLIVRGHRMINWSTGAQSVLADDELEWDERVAPFYYIRCGEFIIGTARAETKCSDSPVIVNPHGEYVRVRIKNQESRIKGGEETLILSKFAWEEDPVFENLRDGYEVVDEIVGSELVGQKFEYETYAGKRKFWVIADNVIDMKKGTGAMTISAAHSEDDYELATRLNMKELFFQKIDLNGRMTHIAGPCEGLIIDEARMKSAEIMQEKGLLIAIKENYKNKVPLCYRSNCVVEPMISQQWFISVEKEFTDKATGEMTSLKKLTQEAVRNKHVQIIPERFNKTYFQWIDNLRDWCISRQIWWGHRIPVWYDEDGNIHLPEERTVLLARHGQSEWNRDKIIQGSYKEGNFLTDKGRKQAEDMGQSLKGQGITKVICSDLERAKQTAEIVSEILGVEIEIWPELKEVGFGKYEGESYSKFAGIEVEDFEYEEMARKMADGDPEMESSESIRDRISKADIRFKELPKEEKPLVISHGALLGFMQAIRKNVPQNHFRDFFKSWDPQNGSVQELKVVVNPSGDNLKQDEDTLDTWFSSALWPFSTLGWPEEGDIDYQKFYPNDVLETGHDILFFWVARMIMFGRYATGKYPYHTVYLHGLVCDEHGKKMSKSKGNGIDPLDVIEEFGADAVRLSLVIGTSPGNSIPLGKAKISGYRNFVNKLWNAGRFVKMQLDQANIKFEDNAQVEPKTLADKWIASSFSEVSKKVEEHLNTYHISQAGDMIYHFVWGEFCDWYLEAQKAEPNPEFLAWIYFEILTLVHPLCPFVTESIYQQFWGAGESLMDREYPKVSFEDQDAEKLFDTIQQIVTEIRKIRSDKKLNPKEKVKVVISCATVETHCNVSLRENSEIIKVLANLSECKIEENAEKPEKAVVALVHGMEVFVEVPFDEGAEKSRLEKEIQELQKSIASLEGRLSNNGYIEKAPEHLVAQTRVEMEKAKDDLGRLEEELKIV